MKVIIDIPEKMYENVQNKTYCGSIYPYLEKAIPLDDVRSAIADIPTCFDYDAYKVKTEVLEILDNIGKESEEE